MFPLIIVAVLIFIFLVYYYRTVSCKQQEESFVSDDNDVVEFTPQYPHTSSGSKTIDGYKIGYAHTQGLRPSMEDDMAIKKLKNGTVFVSLFDGHGGDSVAKMASREMPGVIDKHMRQGLSCHDALKKGIPEIQKMIVDSDIDDVNVGSTVIASVLKPRPDGTGHAHWFANLGDSRALAIQDGKILIETLDHKPDDPKEEKFIRANGGFVQAPPGDVARLNGQLAVSRALGDTYYGQAISHEPDLYRFEAFDTIVLACDGLWDVVSNEEVAKLVSHKWSGMSPKRMAEKLRNLALDKGSTDNISIVVISVA